MKKVALFFLLSLFCSGVYSNPYSLPYIRFSELLFEDGEWKLEISTHEVNLARPIISIELKSMAGETEINVDYIWQWQDGYYLLPDEVVLTNPFYINPQQDSLYITWVVDHYGDTIVQQDSLIYGFENAVVGHPNPGQSITYLKDYPWQGYAKDASPTPGYANDTSGTMGTLSGTVYDVALQPVPIQEFHLIGPFWTSPEGQYSIRVCARHEMRNSIFHSLWGYHKEEIACNIDYIMEPDSLVYFDIYLLEGYTVGINLPRDENRKLFSFHPNPVGKQLSLHYDVDFSVGDKALNIRMLSSASEEVLLRRIVPGKGTLNLPDDLPTGIYIIQLRSAEAIISSGRLVVSSNH